MLKTFARVAALAAAAVLAMMPAAEAAAQTYPTSNPTYIPTALVPATALSAAGDVTMITNGLGTVVVRVAGTNTGVAATLQGTTERSSSPTWSDLSAVKIGGAGGAATAITGDGLYRINTAGLAQIRFHMTAISTGSVSVSMSGTPGPQITTSAPVRRPTYSASVTALAPAASATDFLTISGSATATIRIQEVQCSGVSTAAASATVVGLVRSTANSAGTSTTLTDVPLDSNDAAATAVVKAYTANPTTGTLTGNIRSGVLSTGTAASSAFSVQPLVWQFGAGQAEELTLRGVAQSFSLNGAGASFSSGAALNCSVTWTEE